MSFRKMSPETVALVIENYRLTEANKKAAKRKAKRQSTEARVMAERPELCPKCGRSMTEKKYLVITRIDKKKMGAGWNLQVMHKWCEVIDSFGLDPKNLPI